METSDLRRVLIVDDDSIIRETLRILLKAEGYVVVGEANDGLKAMSMLKKTKPSLVLLDITMPGVSGLELLEDIHKTYPEIMVVMISGEANAETVKTAIEGGAVGYIVKPFNTANVMQNLNRAIQTSVARKKQQKSA